MAKISTKTQFKTDIIKRYKNGESSYKISKSEGCSYNAVLRELKRRGINTGVRFWLKKEIEKLKELYPTTFTEDLLKEFSNRKKESIKGMARNLGLKKRECKKICRSCGEEFMAKFRHNRSFCLKCVKKQWEYENIQKANQRKKRWSQNNPEYIKNYVKDPKVRERIKQYLKRYFKRKWEKDPKFRLDHNIASLIRQSLRGKKAGRAWESLVGYTLEDLIGHLERQFDDKMDWKNYGPYWEVDHIKPRSLFKYTVPEDPEFKKCWALKNLQPLEKIANIRKSNTFMLKPS